MITIFHASALRRTWIFRLALAALLSVSSVFPLFADPVPSLDQLTVIDQGPQITVIWHFYLKLLPAKFIPPGTSAQVALDDPSALRQNLTLLASSAFSLTLDGQPAPLTKISELTVAPDGGCFVSLLYPGRRSGHLQFRETLLPVYPSSYVINYRIYSPLAPARGLSGYLLGGAPPDAVAYTQVSGTISPSFLDQFDLTPVKLFKAELRTAWIDTDWLFLAILLVLCRPARELPLLAVIMFSTWFIPCFFWTMNNFQVPVPLHPALAGLVTAALCVLTLRPSLAFKSLAWSVAAAGLLNGCCDVQQSSLERPAPVVPNLIGLGLGFALGLALIFLLTLILVTECRKLPGFDRDWTPKIVWALALFALILPWLR
jgi:hypothetical protein